MKYFIFFIILILIFTGCSTQASNVDSSDSVSNNKVDTKCPQGRVDDKFPGHCGLYVDKDNNRICDLSE